MGHAFVFCSKLDDKHFDDFIALLNNIKEHMKDPSITDIVEKQGQSLISFFPIEKLICKYFWHIRVSFNIYLHILIINTTLKYTNVCFSSTYL